MKLRICLISCLLFCGEAFSSMNYDSVVFDKCLPLCEEQKTLFYRELHMLVAAENLQEACAKFEKIAEICTKPNVKHSGKDRDDIEYMKYIAYEIERVNDYIKSPSLEKKAELIGFIGDNPYVDQIIVTGVFK